MELCPYIREARNKYSTKIRVGAFQQYTTLGKLAINLKFIGNSSKVSCHSEISGTHSLQLGSLSIVHLVLAAKNQDRYFKCCKGILQHYHDMIVKDKYQIVY